MASTSKRNINWLWWVGGSALLLLGGLAVLPRLLGKQKVAVVPVPTSVTHPSVSTINDLVSTPPGYDYGVANSQYGRFNGYNFAGLAIEKPTNVMPLGFHLNNVL